MTVGFNGKKNPERRQRAESGQLSVLGAPFKEYRKTSTTFAVRMEEAFEVDTLEGMHTGKAGDWLAVGQAGELYPIDGAVFAATYEEVRHGEEEG